MAISMPGMGTGLNLQQLAKGMSQAAMAPKSNELTRAMHGIKAETAALERLESSLEGFYKSLDKLTDPNTFGTLDIKMSSDAKKIFGIKVDETAKPDNYSIEVKQLATRDKWAIDKAKVLSTRPAHHRYGRVGQKS